MTDQVVLVTGAGRGIGREIALLRAAEGAAVVVNNLGVNPEGGATQEYPASSVVAEIRSAGGRAVANKRSIADALAAEKIDTKIVGNPPPELK